MCVKDQESEVKSLKVSFAVCLVGAVILGIMCLCGCASLQGGPAAEVKASPDGGTIGINPAMMAKAWGWVCDNKWGILTGVGASAGTYVYGQHNGWWGSKSNSENGNNAGNNSSTSKTRSYSVSIEGISGSGNTIQVNMLAPESFTSAEVAP